MNKLLWAPSAARVANANITHFIAEVNERYKLNINDYWQLHEWSVTCMAQFWDAFWDYAGVVAQTKGERVLIDEDKLPGARFFPDARLNYAENMLKVRDDSDAVIFWGEDNVRRRITRRSLYKRVSRVAQALRAEGVKPGDCVAAYMPNIPETLVAMLACAAIGAVFTSCSPDFGVRGVLDRFGQVQPVVLFAADGYWYGGKHTCCIDKIREIQQALPSVRKVIVVAYTREAEGYESAKIEDEEPRETFAVDSIPLAVHGDAFVEPYAPGEIAFEKLPFDHPLFVLYSSGTTGAPKCLIHRAGGTLLMHLKEHLLHGDIKSDSRLFYFTTTGWMMWNWQMSALASGATLMLYDGSPFVGRGNILFDYIDATDITHFGTSAKFIDSIIKLKLEPKSTHKLENLSTIFSTGSPLSPDGFDFVYRAIKDDVCLSSISGGTDLLGCFVGGVPTLPVYRSEIQAPKLAMDMAIYDDDGKPLAPTATDARGELVCRKPFPTVPLGFWGDSDGSKFHEAYFARFANTWCHGDYAERTAQGGFVIYGRSDAVLNPGGVRIGTAEIYRQVEKLDEVVESIVVGQDWPIASATTQPNDVRVILFVKLREGLKLDTTLEKRIKEEIKNNTTPRHVPAKVLQVTDIPRTKSGKIVELAVRAVIHGRPIKNREALANAEALAQFENRPELLTK
jgi:acetoacetyl-CoA synthetase